MRVTPSSVLHDPVDVQIEWRTQRPYLDPFFWQPAPTYASEYLALPSDEEAILTSPAALTYTTWYYRVRAGSKATNVWGEWSPAQRFLDVSPVLGSTAGYIDLNIGASYLDATGAIAYIDLNVGMPETTELMVVATTVDLNVGVLSQWKQTQSYADLNVYPPTEPYNPMRYADLNVSPGVPTPHIWWIRPEQGLEGYVFHIFGHGFGAFPGEYSGTVYLGALACQVVEWLIEPDTSTGPEDRVIIHGQGLDPDVITVEHGRITVVVPFGAVSAMVKVVLEG